MSNRPKKPRRATVPKISPARARVMFFHMVRELNELPFEELSGSPLEALGRLSTSEVDRLFIVTDRCQWRLDKSFLNRIKPLDEDSSHELSDWLDPYLLMKRLDPGESFLLIHSLNPLEWWRGCTVFDNQTKRDLFSLANHNSGVLTPATIENRFRYSDVGYDRPLSDLVDAGVFSVETFHPSWLDEESDGLSELRQELSTWLDRWNLNAPWCFVYCAEVLCSWNADPGSIASYELPTVHDGHILGLRNVAPFEIDCSLRIVYDHPFEDFWWQATEPKEEARARMLKKAEREIDSHLSKMERYVEDWLPDNDQTQRDIGILAAFQVFGWSQKRISERFGISGERVSQINAAVSSCLDLPKRQCSTGGRPETSPRTVPDPEKQN